MLAEDAIELIGTSILEESLNEIKHGTKKLADIAVHCCNKFNDSESLHRYSELFLNFFKTAEKSPYISNILHKKIYESLENIVDFYDTKGPTVIYRYSKLLESTLSRIEPRTIETLQQFIGNLEFDLTTQEGAEALYSAFKDYDLILE